MQNQKKTLAVVIGGAFAASLAGLPQANAQENPFAAKSLASGYMVAEADTKPADVPSETKAMDESKMKDGKCAAGNCGSSMKKKKAKAKAEADAKAKEGKCSGEKAKEGNCSSSKQ